MHHRGAGALSTLGKNCSPVAIPWLLFPHSLPEVPCHVLICVCDLVLCSGSGVLHLPACGDERVWWTDAELHQNSAPGASPTLGDLFSPSLDLFLSLSALHRYMPSPGPHPILCPTHVTISLRWACVPCIFSPCPAAAPTMLQEPSLTTPLTTASSLPSVLRRTSR